MIEALPYRDREAEYKEWLNSLPEDERKKNEEEDRIIEENDRKRAEEEAEFARLEKQFAKTIIKDAVEQGICNEYNQTLELPKEAEILLPYSFYKCINIQAAYVHENIRVCTKETFLETDDILLTNPVYKKENGLMINTHLGILLYADDDLDDVIVPDTVVEIAPYAFSGCNMKSIQLPENLEKIGEYSFIRCENLKSISIPPKIKEIPKECFSHCKTLVEIFLPEGLEKISNCCFWEAPFETCLLPLTLKEIGYRSFFNCENLTEINYRNSIKLGTEAFDYCSLLEGKIPNNSRN